MPGKVAGYAISPEFTERVLSQALVAPKASSEASIHLNLLAHTRLLVLVINAMLQVGGR